MRDLFPSITAADLNRAHALLGLYGNQSDDYPLDVKAELVRGIRATVRLMQTWGAERRELDPAAGVGSALHPDLLSLVEKADGDCPEE